MTAEHHTPRAPVTYDTCSHIPGPFFHGTKAELGAHVELVPGYGSNFHHGRVSNNVYFTSLIDTATWGAELAVALTGTNTDTDQRGHIYVVEPLGPFEDDPNVTDKRYPGNPTESYRTRGALLVVSELHDWSGHDPSVLQGMLDRLTALRAQGHDLIED